MTPAEQMKAIKGLCTKLDTHIWAEGEVDFSKGLMFLNISEASEILQALAPILSGELVIVPVEPSWEMQITGRDELNDRLNPEDTSTDDALACYRAMIKAYQEQW